MSSLSNKRILLGVTGGIAAYKSAELLRRFQDRGADVRVVMTRAATEFIARVPGERAVTLLMRPLDGGLVQQTLKTPGGRTVRGFLYWLAPGIFSLGLGIRGHHRHVLHPGRQLSVYHCRIDDESHPRKRIDLASRRSQVPTAH